MPEALRIGLLLATGMLLASPSSAEWHSEKFVSEMTDHVDVTVFSYADRQIKNALGQEITPILTARCVENRTTLALITRTPLHGAEVEIRFDKAPKRTVTVHGANGAAVFFPRPIAHIKEMLGTEKMTLRFTVAFGERQVIAFSLLGLEPHVAELRRACNW